ncbi:NAD(P)/FAD-dependent oxidoreductase [Clostridiales bacterium F-3ap]|uniref:NAD(P)/FAD-dependent oxidoreductase n=2 Tax=Anaerotalea alkaliphila TaxID=2662126 RepID=A0A7X5KN06_9FIRM|nr:NAD(P)/FAD-dependent oxidoreductase [Anaerotalea alkaliphila]
MAAAISLAREGARVLLLEKNEKLGKKLYITGKGRCNLTNASPVENLLENTVSNPKFLYSAFHHMDSFATMAFFRSIGLPVKTERGNRVFPSSEKASDVNKVLEKELRRLGVEVRLHTEVTGLLVEDGVVRGVRTADSRRREEVLEAQGVLLATGGLSYAMTGSTGEGLEFAAASGHRLVEPVPSLVPLETREEEYAAMQGLALKNVSLALWNGKKKLYEGFGEMLFTHFGLSGPLVLSASAYLPRNMQGEATLSLDLKPGLSLEQLDARVLREFQANMRKAFKNSLDSLLPKTMIPVFLGRLDIQLEKPVDQVTKEERAALVALMKDYRFTVKGPRGFQEAVVTRGGVSTKDVRPGTMESKIVENLYFAGEMLDLDALTGGYNLQIAFSTAFLAGKSMGERLLQNSDTRS